MLGSRLSSVPGMYPPSGTHEDPMMCAKGLGLKGVWCMAGRVQDLRLEVSPFPFGTTTLEIHGPSCLSAFFGPQLTKLCRSTV